MTAIIISVAGLAAFLTCWWRILTTLACGPSWRKTLKLRVFRDR